MYIAVVHLGVTLPLVMSVEANFILMHVLYCQFADEHLQSVLHTGGMVVCLYVQEPFYETRQTAKQLITI